jgi:hypothetical protein
VDDLAILGVDDGEKVGRLDARAFVEAGEVEESSGGACSASWGDP